MIITSADAQRVRAQLLDKLSLLREKRRAWGRRFPGFDLRDFELEDDAITLRSEIHALRLRLRELRADAGEFDHAYEVMRFTPSAEDVWKPIPIEGLGNYEASAGGFIRSRITGTVYTRRVSGKHLWVSLIDDVGKPVRLRVDKLVATAWLSDPPKANLLAKNGDAFDCRKENLQWIC